MSWLWWIFMVNRDNREHDDRFEKAAQLTDVRSHVGFLSWSELPQLVIVAQDLHIVSPQKTKDWQEMRWFAPADLLSLDLLDCFILKREMCSSVMLWKHLFPNKMSDQSDPSFRNIVMIIRVIRWILFRLDRMIKVFSRCKT